MLCAQVSGRAGFDLSGVDSDVFAAPSELDLIDVPITSTTQQRWTRAQGASQAGTQHRTQSEVRVRVRNLVHVVPKQQQLRRCATEDHKQPLCVLIRRLAATTLDPVRQLGSSPGDPSQKSATCKCLASYQVCVQVRPRTCTAWGRDMGRAFGSEMSQVSDCPVSRNYSVRGQAAGPCWKVGEMHGVFGCVYACVRARVCACVCVCVCVL